MHLYIGLMSGTSMDAIDAALVDFSVTPLNLIAFRQFPLADATRELLGSIASTPMAPIKELARADVFLGREFAAAATALHTQAGIDSADIRAIGSHGQTMLHHAQPPDPFTVQIADPNLIASHTGIRTVADFRRKDIAVGGQGAPLAPAFHEHVFGGTPGVRAILNIGGIANLTILSNDQNVPTTGFDTGPGNALLDDWAQRHRQQPFDTDGAWAAGGSVDATLLTALLADPYVARAPPKSTGREYYNLRWLDAILATQRASVSTQDVQASLTAFTCKSIANQLRTRATNCRELLVCGGGVHNRTIMRQLSELLPGITVDSTVAFGLDPDAVEAVAFAWLAKRRLEGLPGNLPLVTGASQPVILGAIYEAN